MSTTELNVLTATESVRYHDDFIFRNKINSENRKISLDLSCCDNVFNTKIFESVHALNLSCYENVVDAYHLMSINTLNLSGCKNIVNIEKLIFVHDLNLRTHCMPIQKLSNTYKYYNMKFVSRLGFYHDLHTCHTEKSIHFNNFNSMRKLNLSGCEKIKDIGYLRKLEELIITTEIRDIHLLINLKKLSINEDCNNTMKRRINKLKKINPDVEIIFI
jgi:hypothetical protein